MRALNLKKRIELSGIESKRRMFDIDIKAMKSVREVDDLDIQRWELKERKGG